MKESEVLISTPPPFSEALPEKGISYWKDAWIRLRANRPAIFGLTILVIMIGCAIIVPFFSPHTYYETHLALKNNAPCASFWFGTDELGRDLFTRIWWGARISLFVGITAAVIDMAIGVFYGAFAGMVGGEDRSGHFMPQ